VVRISAFQESVDDALFEQPLQAPLGSQFGHVAIGADIWVLHAFQKKSTQGIKTPKREIDLVHERLKRLREALR